MDMHGQITGGDLNWDNPEVTFEPVPCTEWEGPSWDCSCDASEGNSSTTQPTTDTTTPMTPTTEFTTQAPPITETTTGNPSLESDGYCPSAQDLVVAYGNGVVLQDQGWTVSGDGGAATKAAYNLNGGYVEYDIDVSGATAGTIPNVYSIAPSGLGAEGFVKDRDYCDGADQHEYPWCVEVDWIESNGACGGATTVHTIPGTGPGSCNAWGCRTEYHNDAPKFHMRIDYDDAGHMTVSRDGQPIAAMDPAPQDSDYDAIKKMHDSSGAVIYSSIWTGSWVPGPTDCGTGPAELAGSTFTVSNLKIHGSVVQGPEPQRCSSQEPTTAPVDPTTQEPTTAPVEPTTVPVEPTTQEPTTAPLEPTTLEPTIPPMEPTTQEPTAAPVEPTTVPVEPTTQEPTTPPVEPPVEPTTQEPTTAPLGPTTLEPTIPPMEPTTQEPTTAPVEPTTIAPVGPTPSPERCHSCLTICAPCKECTEGPDGSFAFGNCEKCWHCWDWDDDELEDDDDDMDKDCDALHKKHDWDDDEVRCLTQDHEDCRACWAELGEVVSV